MDFDALDSARNVQCIYKSGGSKLSDHESMLRNQFFRRAPNIPSMKIHD